MFLGRGALSLWTPTWSLGLLKMASVSLPRLCEGHLALGILVLITLLWLHSLDKSLNLSLENLKALLAERCMFCCS